MCKTWWNLQFGLRRHHTVPFPAQRERRKDIVFTRPIVEKDSLAVQELHDGLQDVVSVLRHTAGVAHVGSSLDLSQDVAHLLHILLNMRLETAGRKQRREVWRLWFGLRVRVRVRVGVRVSLYLTEKILLRSSMTLLSLT